MMDNGGEPFEIARIETNIAATLAGGRIQRSYRSVPSDVPRALGVYASRIISRD